MENSIINNLSLIQPFNNRSYLSWQFAINHVLSRFSRPVLFITVFLMFTELTKQLHSHRHLTPEQVRDAVAGLTDEAFSAEEKAGFLAALAEKGETVEEIAGFANELRERSIQPCLDAATRAGAILDVCGTGGDHLRTFNISTTVALVASAAGVTVAKHGNRAGASQSGSADVLEALGIPVDLTPERAAESLQQHRFAFLFAPKFHPAFKHIIPARKLCAERGQRTIFNLLGPLLNPARPSAQLIGVPREELCEPMAKVLKSLGILTGMVVSGRIPNKNAAGGISHLDEYSNLGDNLVAEFGPEKNVTVSTVSPGAFPVQPAALDDLAGSDSRANAEITRRILRGEDRGPRRDAVLLNCAAALYIAGKCPSRSVGWSFAAEVIDSGRAFEKLLELSGK